MAKQRKVRAQDVGTEKRRKAAYLADSDHCLLRLILVISNCGRFCDAKIRTSEMGSILLVIRSDFNASIVRKKIMIRAES